MRQGLLCRMAIALVSVLFGLAPRAAWAAEPAMLVLELRWVSLSTPSGAGLSSSAGLPPGPHRWGTRAAGDAVEPVGPALRVLAGETARWSLGSEAPVAWVLRRPQGVPVQVPVPLTTPDTPASSQGPRWQLEALPRWPDRRGPVLLQLRWTSGEPPEHIATTLRVPPGRWTGVALRREGAAPASEPGVLRSSAATPERTRELQVRVSPVLE